jgi:hypothetical protein
MRRLLTEAVVQMASEPDDKDEIEGSMNADDQLSWFGYDEREARRKLCPGRDRKVLWQAYFAFLIFLSSSILRSQQHLD